jgi:hypothetical protein
MKPNTPLKEKIQSALQPHLQDIRAGHSEKIADAIIQVIIDRLPEKIDKDIWIGSLDTMDGYNTAIDDVTAMLMDEKDAITQGFEDTFGKLRRVE